MSKDLRICKQVHEFKETDYRSDSHLHTANHYPLKNGKYAMQQIGIYFRYIGKLIPEKVA